MHHVSKIIDRRSGSFLEHIRPIFFFFRMAYLNAWLTSFVGYTLLYSLLGWTTRGRHHTPVSVCLTGGSLHRDFSLLFCEKWSGFFYVHRVWLSYTRDRRVGLKSPPKDLAMRIKRLAKGRYCRDGIWTHAEPPVWKFAVYRLALRPLSNYTNLNKKCAEIYVLILLGDFCNQFLTLLDTSWRFLNGRKDQELLKLRGTCSKNVWLFDQSCPFLNTSWSFLTTSQRLLDGFSIILD